MISFRLYGYKQYAGVLVPDNITTITCAIICVWFFLPDAISYQSINVSPSDALPFIYVVPALRGQSLTLLVNNISYRTPTSEGTRNDAFDGATDDAIACLNAVAIAFNADTARVMVRGGSRGGTVALLMAERDKRVKRAAAVAFPADLLVLTSTHTHDDTYQFQFLDALTSGNATLEQTRMKMIASSPLFFCRQLPKTQIHFGDKDDITPVTQGEMLFNSMRISGLDSNMEFYIYPNRDHHNIADNNSIMADRIQGFFRQLW